MLVSVHAPKAGGTSVGQMLARYFGTGFIADYTENPADPSSPRALDPVGYLSRKTTLPPKAACIHGHFHPGKYELGDAFLFTILREPVDNIISIYFYWKRMPRRADALHRYFIDRELSILEMARLPTIQWLYSRTYFGGFDMGRFDLIGRHDQREAALGRLAESIDARFDTSIKERVGPTTEERQRMEADPALRRGLEDILADDIRFYEQHTR